MIKKIFILAIFLVSFIGCKEKDFIVQRDYPVIITNQPTSNDETGVTLSAEIRFQEKERIQEMGFIWRRGVDGRQSKQIINASPYRSDRV